MATFEQQKAQIGSGLEQARTTALEIQGQIQTLSDAPQITGTPATSDAILSELTKTLGGKAGSVASSSTDFSKFFEKAETALETGKEETKRAIDLATERQIREARETGAEQAISFQETRRGFAQNAAALTQIKESTRKKVGDLEARRLEAIASGNAKFADSIADLQMDALRFEQDAERNVFSNMLSLGRFKLETEREERIQEGVDRGDTQIRGSASEGFYTITTDASGVTTIKELMEGTDTGKDELLSLSQVQTLVDRGAEFQDPISGESRPYQIGDRMSDVGQQVGEKITKANIAELRSAAHDTASQFTDKAANRWGVPQDRGTPGSIQEEVERLFGTDIGNTIHEDQLELFLSIDTGLDPKTITNIIQVREAAGN